MPGILIDVVRLILRRVSGSIPTGIDRVTLEYVRHYADRARAVLSAGPLAAPLSKTDSARLFAALLEPPQGGFKLMAAWMATKNALWNWIAPRASTSILLNTSHQWFDSSQYAWQLRWLGARPVFFIHDLIPIGYPEYSIAGEALKYRERIRKALSLSDGIIVNSSDTKAALERYAAEIGLRCPPTVVAPLAPSVAARPAPGAAPDDRPYFVVVGTIEPRKNHWLLLQLWRRMAEEHGDAAPRLYVIGQRSWESENVVDLLERCELLKGLVIEDGTCGDERLASLLQHARALLMPTFAEGYGLPVVEALAAGVPVIASDIPIFREIAGDVPEYADPLDGRRWLELIGEYAKDGPRRRAQLRRIAGFQPTTWARHFEIVDEFLESLP